MAINRNVISKFVKSTKDTTNSKKETFVQGWVKPLGDGYGVQIDGSNIITPATMTTNIDTEKPVTVLIKNHKATIIGNATSDTKLDTSSTIANSTFNLNRVIVPIADSFINSLWEDFE